MAARRKQADAPAPAERFLERARNVPVGVKQHVDRCAPGLGKLAQGASDRLQPVGPAFAAVARGEQSRRAGFAKHRRGQVGARPEHCVDARIAGDEDIALNSLLPQIGRGERRGREQKVGARVDRRSIFLLRPRHCRVVAAQARLDMRDWNGSPETGERAAERARRVTLHDQQVRAHGQRLEHGLGDLLDMAVGVGRPGAAEPDRLAVAKAVVGWIEVGVLPGDDQRRAQAKADERAGNRGKLDCLGPRADD